MVGASMMRTAWTARENWPRSPYRRACLCQRCRAGTIDRLADQSLSVALAHAQNRVRGALPRNAAAEDTIDKDISVSWSPRVRFGHSAARPPPGGRATSSTRSSFGETPSRFTSGGWQVGRLRCTAASPAISIGAGPIRSSRPGRCNRRLPVTRRCGAAAPRARNQRTSY